MATVPHETPELDRKGLRNFGYTTGVIVAMFFGLFFPWVSEHPAPLWPWVLCGILIVWALFAPASLRPMYRVWMQFGLLLSRITTPIILGLVFFILLTPIAVTLRVLGWDAMARKLDDSLASYRIDSGKAAKNSLRNPF